jgi:lysophospholipase L1-like esterase
MTSLRSKLLLAAGVGLAAAGVGAWWLGARRGPARTRLIDDTDEVNALLLSRRDERGADPSRTIDPSEASIEDVRRMFAFTETLHAYDPQTYYRFRSDFEERYTWPEHPDGYWTRATNAAGRREDTPAAAARPDLRLVVIGDSHTEGICNNDESFANRLEARLAAARPGEVVEVVNAGTMGWSFYNYLGATRKLLDELDPDLVVVAFFSGNDFVEVLKPAHFHARSVRPPRPEGYWERIRKVTKISSEALTQGLNQVLYFQAHPHEADLAFEAARTAFDDIRRTCDERGVPLRIVHVPSAFDLERPRVRELLDRFRTTLELSDYDLGVGRRLTRKLLADLDAAGLEVLDLSDELSAMEGEAYWFDFHINLRANERVAELLEGWLPLD